MVTADPDRQETCFEVSGTRSVLTFSVDLKERMSGSFWEPQSTSVASPGRCSVHFQAALRFLLVLVVLLVLELSSTKAEVHRYFPAVVGRISLGLWFCGFFAALWHLCAARGAS